MKPTPLIVTLSLALLAGACAKQNDTPLESAVDNTKDALDVRDHEAIKDAGEDVQAAAANAGEAAHDAAVELKDAVKDAAPK